MTPAEIARAKESQTRLGPTLDALTDEAVRRPSRLPGWSVAHVLTHLARNADSHVRLLEAAGRDQVGDQYPGGNEQRSADIEAGAGRPAAALVDDVVTAASRLEDAWSRTPEEVWRTGRARVAGGVWALAQLPFRRWREVEVHHADLGLGYGPADWPEDYVDAELARSIADLPPRLTPGSTLDIRATDTGEQWLVGDGAGPAETVSGEVRVLLAWVIGRAGGEGYPSLGPWTG